MKMRHTNKRGETVQRMVRNLPCVPLSGGLDPTSGWTPVSTLVKEAEHCNAFRRPDGRPLRNLRETIHREIKKLKANGQMEMMQQPGPRGMVAYVRERPSNVTYLRTKGTDLVMQRDKSREIRVQACRT